MKLNKINLRLLLAIVLLVGVMTDSALKLFSTNNNAASLAIVGRVAAK